MLDPKMKNELRMLVNLSMEGQATEDQCRCLNDMLRSNPDAFDYYLELIEIHHTLRTCDWRIEHESLYSLRNVLEEFAVYEQTAPKIEISEERPSPELIQKVIYPDGQSHKVNKLNIVTLVVSAAAMLFIMVFIRYVPDNKSDFEMASLNAAVDAQWSDSVGLSNRGDRICAGQTFSLTEGLVEIITDNDVDLIFEGPADFVFTQEGDLRLEQGKVCAIVPAQGIGFTVTTASSKIIDLGTEFGVQASKVGNTEAHVYKGKVTLMASRSSPRKPASEVTAGQARLIKSDGTIRSTPVDNHLFVQKNEFMVNVRASQGSGYDRWLAYSYKLRRNPDLVAYYTFEQDKQKLEVLDNKAIKTEGRLDGNLYSALDGPLPTWVNGRWPQKTALHFNRKDRQVVVVPSDPVVHITGPITIAAWIKCSTPEEGGHIVSCRLPNGNGNYQFAYNNPRREGGLGGEIQFARIKYDAAELLTDRIYSKQSFSTSPQWRFMAVTHDNQTVKMYVDGRHVETHEFVYQPEPLEADLVIGADRVEGDPSRFRGDIGELMIFNRVLDADEIGEIYQAGQP